MCGIAGYRGPFPEHLVEEMLECLTYRGPDSQGTYVDEGIALGNRRLSIIGRDTGDQPVQNEDGTVQVVYNGEIYNFRKLRSQLEAEGHRFTTETDTEVLVHGYEEWGFSLPTKLNGMFAFALWDDTRERLVLGRDRMGIKPLYYAHTDEGLLFGSEIKALLQHAVPRDIDHDAIRQYLHYRAALGAKTPFEAVRKLRPGHMLVYEDDEVSTRQYWTLPYEPRDLTPDAAAKRIRKELEDAVEKRLIAEVPVAAFLSGGLDSSTIVALMQQHKETPLKTFSAGFPGNAEHGYAETTAEHVGADHTRVDLTTEELFDAVPEVVRHLDEPMADPAVFPSYLLSRAVKDEATVFLLGEGSDEEWGGYSEYLPGSTWARYAPDVLKRAAFRWFRLPRTGLAQGDPKELNRSLTGSKPFLDRATRFDLRNSIPNFQCVKVDRMSMAHSLEARVPFLDHRVVELSQRVPAKYKMRGMDEKWILKKAVKDLLPKKIVQRRKQVFFTPVQDWMEQAAKGSQFDVLEDARIARDGLVDDRALGKLLASDNRYGQYMAFMLEHWYRTFGEE